MTKGRVGRSINNQQKREERVKLGLCSNCGAENKTGFRNCQKCRNLARNYYYKKKLNKK